MLSTCCSTKSSSALAGIVYHLVPQKSSSTQKGTVHLLFHNRCTAPFCVELHLLSFHKTSVRHDNDIDRWGPKGVGTPPRYLAETGTISLMHAEHLKCISPPGKMVTTFQTIFQEYVFMDENMGNSVRITLEYYSKISYEQLIYTLCKESKTKHWNMRKFSKQWCIWITGLQCVNKPSNLGRFGSHVLMLLHVQKISTNTEMIVEIKSVTVGFPSQKAKNAPSTFNCRDTIMCSCN